MTAARSTEATSEEGLLARVAGALDVDPGRLGLRRLARGVTHETRLVERDGGPIAVLRLAPLHPGILPGHEPAAEGELLRALEGTGVPVPEVLAVDRGGGVLGRPGLLLSYVEGRSTRTWEELRAIGGEAAAEQALEILLALHRIDPELWSGSAGNGRALADRELERWGSVAREAAGDAPPALAETIAALAAAGPAATTAGPCCIHGDFRPANLMVTAAGIGGVLDWEMATVGDPACDLGLSTMAAWGVWWDDDELLSRYESGGGLAPEPAALRWWRCLGYVKVVAFLARRTAMGWEGAPPLGPFVDGMLAARSQWEGSR